MDAIFNIIAIPFGYVMQFCYWIAQGNYLLSLLIFSFIIELVLLPFAIKQQKNSIKAASLKPKEMAIRKKYAGRNDQPTQQKMMQEIQEMQQKEGYSPFSGCLPLLIQLPLIMALYNIVYDPFKYILNFSNETIEAIKTIVTEKGYDIASEVVNNRTIGLLKYIREIGVESFSGIEQFAERIKDVSDLPNLTIFGMNLAENPSFTSGNWLLLLIPVLTFVVYYLSSKLSRKFMYQASNGVTDQQAACSNTMMDVMMPLMSVSFTFMVPAAIGVYWIFRSVLGTLKSFIMSKVMPLPTFTDEDYKAAEKEFKSKNNQHIKAGSSNRERDPNKPKVRSLHHIDDEDYEIGFSAKKTEEPKKTEPTETEVGGMKVEQAPTKKDDRELK